MHKHILENDRKPLFYKDIEFFYRCDNSDLLDLCKRLQCLCIKGFSIIRLFNWIQIVIISMHNYSFLH